MKYQILKSGYCYELEKDVNKLITKGWEPIGGICASMAIGPGGGSYEIYAQAMILEEEKDN
jgi:hypothetical protein